MRPGGSSFDESFSFNVVGVWRRRASKDPFVARMFLTFGLTSLVQAVAQAFMATSAGLLGQALINPQGVARLPIVDSLNDRGLDFGRTFAAIGSTSPFVLCLVGAVAALGKAVAGGIAAYAQRALAFATADGVRQELASEVLDGGTSAGGEAPAEAHARIVVRLGDLEGAVDAGLLAAFRSTVTLLPLALTLIWMSRWLAIAALGALAVFGIASSRARGGLARSHGRAASLAEKLHAELDGLLGHLELWRTFGAEGRAREALARSGRAAERASARADAEKALASGSNEVAAALVLLAVIGAAGAGLLRLGDGPIVAFAAVFFLMYRPLRDLAEARVWVARGHAALRVLAEAGWNASPTLHADPSTPPVVIWASCSLSVRELTVAPSAGWTTAPVSFEAHPGEMIAVVGPTGSGKTSLLRGLLGLAPIVSGAVLYGEDELMGRGVGPGARPFAWVPQEPAIFAGTLADNITLGAASREEATRALRAIGATALEARLDDRLSADGPELSGGERQWIAIARALATRLPVLLMDEPTAGLDSLSQERVLRALGALKGERTVVLVTHRPEPLALADRVVEIGRR